MTTNTPDSASELARVIRQNLPDRLRLQLANTTITPRAEALARAGWTQATLSLAITHRTWTGAGAGAFITWLDDLAASPPPRPAAKQEDSTDRPRSGSVPSTLGRTRIRGLGVSSATTGTRVGCRHQ